MEIFYVNHNYIRYIFLTLMLLPCLRSVSAEFDFLDAMPGDSWDDLQKVEVVVDRVGPH